MIAGKTDLNAQLARVAKEPFYVVPHSQHQVEEVISSCVDLYWERRRYGEPWEDYAAPPELFDPSETGPDMEAKSKQAFKKFLFNLTGDILRDTFNEEESDHQDDDLIWQKPHRLVKRKFYRGIKPPSTIDEVRPIVEENVLKLLGLKTDPAQAQLNKWSSRKRRDHVDKVLLKELREEEPEWINYGEDELTVKNQIADSIFESLLTETAGVMMNILESRNSH